MDCPIHHVGMELYEKAQNNIDITDVKTPFLKGIISRDDVIYKYRCPIGCIFETHRLRNDIRRNE